jgi:hypothetical protein
MTPPTAGTASRHAVPSASLIPPQPFLGISVRLRERWELWKNRAER